MQEKPVLKPHTPVTITFFFDLSSPWTRLAWHNLKPIVAHSDATVTYRPFLVGGVFNAVNQGVYARRDSGDTPQMRHYGRWLDEWAAVAGVAMQFPSMHHPLKSVHAMRLCCALEADQPTLLRFAEAAFDAYFAHQQNLDDPAVLAAILTALNLDADALLAAANSDAVKARLRANTDEAIARGAYGSPTFFIDGEHMYFGNDQLPLLAQRMALITSP